MRHCRRRHFLVLAGIFVLIIAVAIASPSSIPSALSQAPSSGSQQSSAEAPSSFSFGAGGDIGANSSTSASLDALKASGASFFLALGDMSYDEVTPESAWCDYIKQRMGSTYPFELIVGNHEETTAGPDGFIDNFAACMPDHLGASGLYAHQYYFDYPAGEPLARFILIDPDLYRGAAKANYCTNGDTTNCDWLKARIDEAKSQGLWTVVAMHKNCITMGVKSCEIGVPLLNVLAERKVDLILQGHDHSYQRSKQLSLGAGCTALAANVYDSDCVIDDGTDGAYAKGAGPVLAIAANFGRSSNAINTSDPEVPYFSAWMDPSLNSRGFLLFTVSRDTIDAQFVSGNGSYSDSFVISTGGTPSPTPTPGGTIPPVPTSVPSTNMVTFMAEADSYVRSDQRSGNFGNSLKLRIDGSPVLRSYLRFDVQGLEGPVANATLYMYANSGSRTGYQVGGVSDNRWTETGLTYRNAPAVGSPVGSSGAIEPNTWTRVDVTALVGDNGTLNLAMFGSNETAIAFSSRDGTNPPMLVVATGEQAAASQVAAAAEPLASKPPKDSDGDGLRDEDELQNDTDPDKPDTDGDGLSDLWEVEVGLNPVAAVGEDGAQGDPEGDGTPNLDEFSRQTDPWGPDVVGTEQLYLPLIESNGTR